MLESGRCLHSSFQFICSFYMYESLLCILFAISRYRVWILSVILYLI